MNVSGDWTVWKATFTVWITGSKYLVDARVKDAAGNYSTAYATSSFRYDTSAPQSYVFLPANKPVRFDAHHYIGNGARPARAGRERAERREGRHQEQQDG